MIGRNIKNDLRRFITQEDRFGGMKVDLI